MAKLIPPDDALTTDSAGCGRQPRTRVASSRSVRRRQPPRRDDGGEIEPQSGERPRTTLRLSVGMPAARSSTAPDATAHRQLRALRGSMKRTERDGVPALTRGQLVEELWTAAQRAELLAQAVCRSGSRDGRRNPVTECGGYGGSSTIRR